MRHRKAGRHLGRSKAHREALRRSLARAILLRTRIVTTKPKAAEARGLVEHLIGLGKRGDLHARRQAASLLGNDKALVRRLFTDVAPRFSERAGGYTRILHGAFRASKKEGKAHALPLRPWAFHSNRLGDNAPRVVFELTEDVPPVADEAPGGIAAKKEAPSKVAAAR